MQRTATSLLSEAVGTLVSLRMHFWFQGGVLMETFLKILLLLRRVRNLAEAFYSGNFFIDKKSLVHRVVQIIWELCGENSDFLTDGKVFISCCNLFQQHLGRLVLYVFLIYTCYIQVKINLNTRKNIYKKKIDMDKVVCLTAASDDNECSFCHSFHWKFWTTPRIYLVSSIRVFCPLKGSIPCIILH